MITEKNQLFWAGNQLFWQWGMYTGAEQIDKKSENEDKKMKLSLAKEGWNKENKEGL